MATKITKTLKATAYHEAGHAVASIALRRPLTEASISPSDEQNTLGHCSHPPHPPSFQPDIEVTTRDRLRIEAACIVFFAGGAAETRFLGRRNLVGQTQ